MHSRSQDAFGDRFKIVSSLFFLLGEIRFCRNGAARSAEAPRRPQGITQPLTPR